MSGLPPVAQEFYVLSEPSFRWTQNGTAHCRLFVSAKKRIKDDSAEGGWRDGDSFTASANIYDRPAKKGQTRAENVFESVAKGDSVVIIGEVSVREYEKDGVQQKAVEIDVKEIGPSLRFRSTPHGGGRASSGGQRAAQPPANQNTQPPSSVTVPQDDEPPF